MKSFIAAASLVSFAFFSCNSSTPGNAVTDSNAVKPAVVTEKVLTDSDDPAIWISPTNKDSSIIVGTDKDDANGGLYVFGLNGKIDSARTVAGLKRMNNVDIAYGLQLCGQRTDIAVATERDRNCIRIFSLPAMQAIDGGGIEVFKGETERLPMGIALYTRPADSAIYAIVGRKSGPAEGYLEQYLLKDSGNGQVTAQLVRKFGKYSGKKEIESIAVDNDLGYVYYSDEQTGIRKYYADPAKGNEELAMFGQGQFKEDNEGISIYKLTDNTGYILVSDQAANRFNVYAREGDAGNPHSHKLLVSIPVSTNQSDGSDVTSVSLPGFEGGLFVAMSTDKTFQLYRWKDIAEKAGLKTAGSK
ncbi:phytase [Foetidibacter luteolus]|uniref:phytase n=1 Tax=Foetidibacter luteolus TaxID=2608880 RepID=UPI00129B6A2C|nr:phytase [Foetidibacter luteolus]